VTIIHGNDHIKNQNNVSTYAFRHGTLTAQIHKKPTELED